MKVSLILAAPPNMILHRFITFHFKIRIVNQLAPMVTGKVLAEPRISVISRSDSGVWSTNLMSGNKRVQLY